MSGPSLLSGTSVFKPDFQMFLFFQVCWNTAAVCLCPLFDRLFGVNGTSIPPSYIHIYLLLVFPLEILMKFL